MEMEENINTGRSLLSGLVCEGTEVLNKRMEHDRTQRFVWDMLEHVGNVSPVQGTELTRLHFAINSPLVAI